jgi:hypothetical protein
LSRFPVEESQIAYDQRQRYGVKAYPVRERCAGEHNLHIKSIISLLVHPLLFFLSFPQGMTERKAKVQQWRHQC